MRFYENLAFLLETLQDSTRIYILRESLQKQAKILYFTRIHILRDSADSIDKILQIRKNLAFWILQNHNDSINSQNQLCFIFNAKSSANFITFCRIPHNKIFAKSQETIVLDSTKS